VGEDSETIGFSEAVGHDGDNGLIDLHNVARRRKRLEKRGCVGSRHRNAVAKIAERNHCHRSDTDHWEEA